MKERKELSLEVAFGEKHVDELMELLKDGFLASFMDSMKSDEELCDDADMYGVYR